MESIDHIAIMKKSWRLLPKILSGEKKIESRWYKNKAAPWGRIEAGDTVYFKDSGEPVTVKAAVEKVLSFENLTPEKVHEILEKYGEADGISRQEIAKYEGLFRGKKYCLLIFLKEPQEIEPFRIDKRGFGLPAAWLCVGDIRRAKKETSPEKSGEVVQS